MQIHLLRDTPISHYTYFNLLLALISSRAVGEISISYVSTLRINTGRISAFMARKPKWSAWLSREVGNANFRVHRSNSHRYFSLMFVFDVEQSNLRESMSSRKPCLGYPLSLSLRIPPKSQPGELPVGYMGMCETLLKEKKYKLRISIT
ncbi:hypothetical protein AVEN_262086-1 [Araneus ventricosus]|uniref:Uncharacterized protein n=1 Tax=Araneus ventricosus TaxID=182803 RepID=A0A4Y2S726_ARAVE|nr:hypothetical protein AVEN_262086-1 [Araneus ventricosus]